MGLNTICPHCGGKQNRSGFAASSTGIRYQRMNCKVCKKTEYVALEQRRTLGLEEVIELAKAGRLKVWVDGKVHDVDGGEE